MHSSYCYKHIIAALAGDSAELDSGDVLDREQMQSAAGHRPGKQKANMIEVLLTLVPEVQQDHAVNPSLSEGSCLLFRLTRSTATADGAAGSAIQL